MKNIINLAITLARAELPIKPNLWACACLGERFFLKAEFILSQPDKEEKINNLCLFANDLAATNQYCRPSLWERRAALK